MFNEHICRLSRSVIIYVQHPAHDGNFISFDDLRGSWNHCQKKLNTFRKFLHLLYYEQWEHSTSSLGESPPLVCPSFTHPLIAEAGIYVDFGHKRVSFSKFSGLSRPSSLFLGMTLVHQAECSFPERKSGHSGAFYSKSDWLRKAQALIISQ